MMNSIKRAYLFFICGVLTFTADTAGATEQQVQIEAKLVDVQNNFGQDLGVDFGSHPNDFNQINDFQPRELNAIETEFGRVPEDAINFGTLSNAPGGGSLGNDFGGFGGLPDPELEAVLRAAEARGRAQVMSNPRILTLNEVRAELEPLGGVQLILTPTITPGDQIRMNFGPGAVQVPPSVTLESGQSMQVGNNFGGQVGLELGLTPTINADGNIIMNFQIVTPSIQTHVLVQDGQTLVLGGLISEEVTRDPAKVPLLGDIPALGRFFKSDGEKTKRDELLIFLTPLIIKDN